MFSCKVVHMLHLKLCCMMLLAAIYSFWERLYSFFHGCFQRASAWRSLCVTKNIYTLSHSAPVNAKLACFYVYAPATWLCHLLLLFLCTQNREQESWWTTGYVDMVILPLRKNTIRIKNSLPVLLEEVHNQSHLILVLPSKPRCSSEL